MKIQLLTAATLAPLESSWKTKYPHQKLAPGEIIFSRIEKNYAFFLPEIMMPEPTTLHYVLADLIWNCKEANCSLVLFSFSSFVVNVIQEALADQTLKPEEVDFWWIELGQNERIYTTLKIK